MFQSNHKINKNNGIPDADILFSNDPIYPGLKGDAAVEQTCKSDIIY
jgi:hypothetical protein